MHQTNVIGPTTGSESGAVVSAVMTAGLGVLYVPLGLFSMVTFGPGFPLLCVAAALIAIGFGQARLRLILLRRHRGALLAASAGLLLFGALGAGYLVFAGDPLPRLTGAALLVGAAVVTAWLWLCATTDGTVSPSGIVD